MYKLKVKNPHVDNLTDMWIFHSRLLRIHCFYSYLIDFAGRTFDARKLGAISTKTLTINVAALSNSIAGTFSSTGTVST